MNTSVDSKGHQHRFGSAGLYMYVEERDGGKGGGEEERREGEKGGRRERKEEGGRTFILSQAG